MQWHSERDSGRIGEGGDNMIAWEEKGKDAS